MFTSFNKKFTRACLTVGKIIFKSCSLLKALKFCGTKVCKWLNLSFLPPQLLCFPSLIARTLHPFFFPTDHQQQFPNPDTAIE
jgi:hypothetical protein